jgi:hypothetical protein
LSGPRDNARIASTETEHHHPDISFGFGWGLATVSVSTEKIKGQLVNDFINGEWLLDRPNSSLDFKQ